MIRHLIIIGSFLALCFIMVEATLLGQDIQLDQPTSAAPNETPQLTKNIKILK